jgi:transposase
VNRAYTEEFKADAVRLVKRSGRSYAKAASDLGISYWTLRKWCQDREMTKRSKKTSSSKSAVPVAEETLEEKVERLERENEALRKANETLEMDRAILKKAAAFFAKESE